MAVVVVDVGMVEEGQAEAEAAGDDVEPSMTAWCSTRPRSRSDRASRCRRAGGGHGGHRARGATPPGLDGAGQLALVDELAHLNARRAPQALRGHRLLEVVSTFLMVNGPVLRSRQRPGHLRVISRRCS